MTVAQALRPGEPLSNDQTLRDEVADVLRWWFPTGEVRPDKDEPSDTDLKNELAKRGGR